MIWHFLSWLSQHPADLVVWLLFVVAMTCIISAVVYRLMLASETAKQDAERKRLDRIIKASHAVPKAPGYPHKRVS